MYLITDQMITSTFGGRKTMATLRRMFSRSEKPLGAAYRVYPYAG